MSKDTIEAWLAALRWVMTRPGMVDGLPGGPAPLMHKDDPRLAALLDHSRGAWPALSETLATHKLGLAFEALVVWGMTHGLSWTVLGRDVQVFEGKRTIGALDLVVRDDNGEVTHWEFAYKLYLQCDSGTGWDSWLGPAGRDRLGLKLRHMLEHQLPLSSRPEANATLERLNIAHIDRHRVMMQGTLFSPWSSPPVSPDGGPMPAEGRWLRQSDVSRLVAEHPEWRWIPRTKPLWFGPAPHGAEAVTGQDLLALGPLEESLLFSRLDGASDQLFFIVPECWGTSRQP
ncbi:MAG: DUF1853 family protein [Myxococcota bacterium]